MSASEAVPAPVGRGRGRGRGGEAVLPQGLWDELSGLGGDKEQDGANRDNDVHVNRTHAESDNSDRYDNDSDFIPSGFGRGRGGRGGGRGFGGRGRGNGIEKDKKGPDWTCPSCSNVNWSWRATCNKCNTGKPITMAEPTEVRDGAGGGFNERQGRVSAANVEITDDGFDDFGRRAKGRAEDKRAKEAAALARLQSNYGYLLNPEILAQTAGDATAAGKTGADMPGEDTGKGSSATSRGSRADLEERRRRRSRSRSRERSPRNRDRFSSNTGRDSRRADRSGHQDSDRGHSGGDYDRGRNSDRDRDRDRYGGSSDGRRRY